MGIADRAFATDDDRRAYFEELRERGRAARSRKPAALRPVLIVYSKLDRADARVLYRPPIGPVRKRDVLFIASKGLSPKPAQEIISEICRKHNVTQMDLKSHRRVRWLTIPRMETYYRMREETALSFPQIGRLLGDRDHATVLHGAQKYAKMLAKGEVAL